MKTSEFVLPVTATGLCIEEVGQEIQAKIGYLEALEIQTDIQNLWLVMTQDLSKCEVDFSFWKSVITV